MKELSCGGHDFLLKILLQLFFQLNVFGFLFKYLNKGLICVVGERETGRPLELVAGKMARLKNI